MNQYTYSIISRSKLASTLLILFFGMATYAQVTLQVPASAVVGDSITVSLSSSAGTDTQWWLEGSAQATIFGSNNNAFRLIMTSSGTLVVRARVLDDTTVIYDLTESFPVSGGVPNDPGNPTVLSNNCGAPVLQRTGFTTETGDTWYWQGKTNNGTHTNKGHGSTYTADEGSGTYYIRARSTTGEWSPNSGSVTITVEELKAGTITGAQSICYGADPSKLSTVTDASDGTTYNYQWQDSTATGNWNNILGATDHEFDPSTNLTANRWYRRGVTSCDDNQTIYTTPVQVTVRPPYQAGELDPVAPICYNGDPPVLTGSAPSHGNGSNSYQWQISTDNSNWTNIDGAEDSTYDPPSGLTVPTWYRRVDSSCDQTDETEGILVDVYDPLTAGSIQGEQVLCYGANPGPITNLTLPTGGKNDYEYVWESSPNGVDSWSPIAGEELKDYTPDPNATATTYYRRGVKSCNYTLFADVPVKIEILPQLQAPTGTQTMEVCPDNTATLSLTADSNANTIRWYNVATEGTHLAEGTSFTTPVLNTGTTYYASSYNSTTLCESSARMQVDVNMTTLITWYADDIDQDGLGNPAISLVQCNQPAGYVQNSLDNCPDQYDPSNACVPISNDPETHNYIYTRTYQSEVAAVPTLKFGNDDAYVQQITFFDGLGRPQQQNAIRQSPDNKDIITHIGYDEYGRQDKEWLPLYEPLGSLGDFRTGNLEADTRGYYENHGDYGLDFPTTSGIDVNTYSQKDFEPSPLNRVLKQAAPGEDWKLGNGHEIEFDYTSNSASDNVKEYKVSLAFANNTYTPTLVDDGTYTSNELFKNITYDENHDGSSSKLHTTEEFTDKQGRVVLKRTYADLGAVNEVAHDTYYVYDDFGNLTFVLPPLVDTSATIDQTILDNLCYQYVYDHRNRLVEKQLPGKEREFIVYNKLDQPIMTQDSIQRISGEWLFTKYDAFGRVAYTGKTVEMNGADPVSRMDVQVNANNATGNLWVQRGSGFSMNNITVEYDGTSYPTTISELLTINYYDDHTFNTADEPALPADVFGVSLDSRTKGLATGNMIKVLDPNATPGQETWITTITRYDDKGRPIYTYSQNDYLQTTDVVESLLDFVGKPVKVRSQHTRNGNTVVTLDNFTYDHVGRLLSQTQCIGDQTLGESCGNIIYNDILVLDQPTYTTNQTATDRIEVKATSNPVTLSGTLTLQVDPTANSGGGGSTNEELIVSNDYDELGQLKSKKVGGDPGTNYGNTTGLQTVDYTYNIRGWLKSINDVTDTTPDKLFNFNIVYNGGNTPLYNGNIAQTQWRTDHMDKGLKQYDYSYDALNRITAAVNNVGTDRYGLSGITYDKNGNIQTLVRNGHVVDAPDPTNSQHFDVMDNLTYAYTGNQLTNVADNNANDSYGFVDVNGSGTEYTYDVNGNMTSDANKGITAIGYNHLNLPTSVVINSQTISYIYDAAGTKLRKNAEGSVTDYAGNYVYTDNNGTPVLEFLSHPEGYTSPDGQGAYDYVYQYKDHLGNIRLSFMDNNGTVEIVEENNYYPFGLKHKGYNIGGATSLGNDVAQRWKYQGQELTEDLELNTYEFKYRMHDPSIGRFWQVDPLSENFPYQSHYNFAENRVISGLDLEGLEYLDANVARIKVMRGEVRHKMENKTRTTQSNFRSMQLFGKGGREGHIGVDTRVTSSTLSSIMIESFETIELARKNGVPLNANEVGKVRTTHESVPIAKSTGKPDLRYTGRTLGGITAKTVGGAKSVLAYDALMKGVEYFQIYQSETDKNLTQEHYTDVLPRAISDLYSGISEGMIPDQFMNEGDLSDILNVILQGVIDEPSADPNTLEYWRKVSIGIQIYNTYNNRQDETSSQN